MLHVVTDIGPKYTEIRIYRSDEIASCIMRVPALNPVSGEIRMQEDMSGAEASEHLAFFREEIGEPHLMPSQKEDVKGRVIILRFLGRPRSLQEEEPLPIAV